MHIDNKNKDILILGKGPEETQYWEQQFLFVNATKKYYFKAKDSEIKKLYPLCLGIISGDFSANNMKMKQD